MKTVITIEEDAEGITDANVEGDMFIPLLIGHLSILICKLSNEDIIRDQCGYTTFSIL